MRKILTCLIMIGAAAFCVINGICVAIMTAIIMSDAVAPLSAVTLAVFPLLLGILGACWVVTITRRIQKVEADVRRVEHVSDWLVKQVDAMSDTRVSHLSVGDSIA